MKNVSLLPDNVQIHIASYVSSEAEAVLIFAPDEADNCLEEGEPLSLTIDYPLSKEVTFTVPFSYCVNEMIDVICDKYREIYEEEEATKTHNPEPNPRLYNRPESDGEYGIWGHELGDLFIEILEVDVKNKTLNMFVGS